MEISQREKIPGIEVQTTGIERKECLKQSLRLANPHPPLNPLPSREGKKSIATQSVRRDDREQKCNLFPKEPMFLVSRNSFCAVETSIDTDPLTEVCTDMGINGG